MKLSLHPEMMIRIPQFHLDAELKTEWDNLKDAIKISSPEFYEYIRNTKSSEIVNLPRDIYHTVWKYFNRAKYRSTPYGSFAGFGIARKVIPQVPNITINKTQSLANLICWSERNNNALFLKLNKKTLLFANSSYYPAGENLRYLTYSANKFSIEEVQNTGTLLRILKACYKPIALTELQSILSLSIEDLRLIREMVKCKLLITDAFPNIIGEDFYQRTGRKNSPDKPQYIIAERKVVSGFPDSKHFEDLKTLIRLLKKLTPANHISALTVFATKFVAKYENQAIPLMSALDPEFGIAYTGASTDVEENQFIKLLGHKHEPKDKAEMPIVKLLLAQIGTTYNKPINLESLSEYFTSENSVNQLPNSIGVLCSVVDGLVIVDHIGGSTASSLAGRFSMASEEAMAFCKGVISDELKANPNVLFFDIAYAGENGNTDNVNRRKIIYPFQLSLLNFDTTTNPLTLDDLFITVSNGEIILFSHRLQRRVIPRFASAYNYTRADLPVFLFLCDLQFQNLTPNLYLNLSTTVPGLNYYPRVQYKNIILTPAKWKVSLKNIVGTTIIDMNDYLNGLEIPRYCIIRTEDRTMFFDRESIMDSRELFHVIKKFKSFYLEEGFKPKNSLVLDCEGNAYASQFLVSLTHQQEIYQPIKIPYNIQSPTDMKHNFAAGSEWVYYEIFTHPSRTSFLFNERLVPFLKIYRKIITAWFFIRFNENGEHIRLRLKLKNKSNAALLINQLAELLHVEIDNGIISDFRLRIYKREIDRYGADLIEDIEKHFHIDSKYAILLMKYNLSDNNKYNQCLTIIQSVHQSGLFSQETFSELLKNCSNSFILEHQISGDGYRLLNQQYKIFRDFIPSSLSQQVNKHSAIFERSLNGLLFKCPPDRRAKLFVDLLHMHINRLFEESQRTHEMVIYYFAVKQVAFKKAMLKQEMAQAI